MCILVVRRALATLTLCTLATTLRPLPAVAQAAAKPAASSTAPALTGAARWADTVRVSIERAVLAGDTRGIAAAGALADRALTAFPNEPLLLHYRAYALYREFMTGSDTQSDASTAAFERAIDLLQRSAAVRPMAETQALLSSCHGALAAGGVIAGMRHGRASSEARDAALAAGPNNPRVLMLGAISLWFTPKMWGGGEDKGYAMLQRAVAAYATDAPPAPLPSWGHAESYAWLGQMEAKRGNPAAARAAYAKALSIAPDYVWVKRVLMPAVAQR